MLLISLLVDKIEIQRAIEIPYQRKKNNGTLVGEFEIVKIAFVKVLVIYIIKGDVPNDT